MSFRNAALLLTLLIFSSGFGLSLGRNAEFESAWEKLLQQNPQAVDDPGLSWKDRLILHSLTPGQAEAYYQRGVEASDLRLLSGETLAEYLEARLSPDGNLYVQLPAACRLFSGQMLEEGERRTLWARGEDLSGQGGNQEGCAIPDDAVAVMLQFEVEAPLGGRFKLWAAESPEPAQAALEGSGGSLDALRSTALLSLCREDCSEGDFQIRSSQAAQLQGEVMGYFRPLRAEDHPGGGYRFSTEGASNNFFGTGAGASITSGVDNSFFGANAGNAVSDGSYNSFFGGDAGANTTANYNSFFGDDAGKANTTGSENAFFGSDSGLSNTTGSNNAFFGDDAGRNNTEGSSNAFFGENSALSNTTGSRNAFFGRAAGGGNTAGSDNAFFGEEAGASNTTASGNSFFGTDAGKLNVEGSANAFFGYQAGASNTASGNSFFGYQAGTTNAGGYENAFFGRDAGKANTEGIFNSFFGAFAGAANTTGWENAFFGRGAGTANTIGLFNSFFGAFAGTANTEGNYNAFFGTDAGRANTTGPDNSFFGKEAGRSNLIGEANSFFGVVTGFSNTSGSYNAFVGRNAGYFNTTGSNNAFFGSRAGISSTVESNNTLIGPDSSFDPGPDPMGSPVTNATALGHRSFVSQSNSLVLGSINGFNGAMTDAKVGIGTSAPQAPLHIRRTDGTAKIFLEELSTTTATRLQLDMTNKGSVGFNFENRNRNSKWGVFLNNAVIPGVTISRIGTGVFEFLFEEDGDMTIQGTLTQLSDRNAKQDFTLIQGQETLSKVMQLPITEWSYKADRESNRHIGPMAQDFYASFGLGSDDRHISPSDLSGVALAAIQGLNRQVIAHQALQEAKDAQLGEQQQKLTRQQAEIDALKARLEAIEQLLRANSVVAAAGQR